MKKYLLTWYGITDLRAALGLEKSEGPVLSALLAGEYTDVMILGYTNPKKYHENVSDNQQILLDWCQNAEIEERMMNQSKGWKLVDAYSNTKQGHELFSTWLGMRLDQLGKKVESKLFPVELAKLNDTKGIYSAASMCLDKVAEDADEKQVTVYLSPGTPVMAFTWAFASLVNPALKIEIIASSDFRSPPETISLPYDLLDSTSHQPIHNQSTTHEFDAVFHLFGEQRMPAILGIRQFKSKRHVFVNSESYPAGFMKQFIGSSGFSEVSIHPYDPKNIEAKIIQAIAELPAESKIGFNLTGGTKLMYAGALSACNKVNGIPFYFEARNHNLIYLNDFSITETKPIDNVETFILANANDLTISNKGLWKDDPARTNPDRIKLTGFLWQNRVEIQKIYRELSLYNDKPGDSFNIHIGRIKASLNSSQHAEFALANESYAFEGWADFARYLSGGWLEEYTYLILKPFLESGKILDLRIGLEIAFKGDIKKHNNLGWAALGNLKPDPYQEFDIVFSTGKQLHIIECKAGANIKSEHVEKLQNISRYFGGLEGRGILLSAFAPNKKVLLKKISEARNVTSISGMNVAEGLKEIVGKHR